MCLSGRIKVRWLRYMQLQQFASSFMYDTPIWINFYRLRGDAASEYRLLSQQWATARSMRDKLVDESGSLIDAASLTPERRAELLAFSQRFVDMPVEPHTAAALAASIAGASADEAESISSHIEERSAQEHVTAPQHVNIEEAMEQTPELRVFIGDLHDSDVAPALDTSREDGIIVQQATNTEGQAAVDSPKLEEGSAASNFVHQAEDGVSPSTEEADAPAAVALPLLASIGQSKETAAAAQQDSKTDDTTTTVHENATTTMDLAAGVILQAAASGDAPTEHVNGVSQPSSATASMAPPSPLLIPEVVVPATLEEAASIAAAAAATAAPQPGYETPTDGGSTCGQSARAEAAITADLSPVPSPVSGFATSDAHGAVAVPQVAFELSAGAPSSATDGESAQAAPDIGPLLMRLLRSGADEGGDVVFDSATSGFSSRDRYRMQAQGVQYVGMPSAGVADVVATRFVPLAQHISSSIDAHLARAAAAAGSAAAAASQAAEAQMSAEQSSDGWFDSVSSWVGGLFSSGSGSSSAPEQLKATQGSERRDAGGMPLSGKLEHLLAGPQPVADSIARSIASSEAAAAAGSLIALLLRAQTSVQPICHGSAGGSFPRGSPLRDVRQLAQLLPAAQACAALNSSRAGTQFPARASSSSLHSGFTGMVCKAVPAASTFFRRWHASAVVRLPPNTPLLPHFFREGGAWVSRGTADAVLGFARSMRLRLPEEARYLPPSFAQLQLAHSPAPSHASGASAVPRAFASASVRPSLTPAEHRALLARLPSLEPSDGLPLLPRDGTAGSGELSPSLGGPASATASLQSAVESAIIASGPPFLHSADSEGAFDPSAAAQGNAGRAPIPSLPPSPPSLGAVLGSRYQLDAEAAYSQRYGETAPGTRGGAPRKAATPPSRAPPPAAPAAVPDDDPAATRELRSYVASLRLRLGNEGARYREEERLQREADALGAAPDGATAAGSGSGYVSWGPRHPLLVPPAALPTGGSQAGAAGYGLSLSQGFAALPMFVPAALAAPAKDGPRSGGGVSDDAAVPVTPLASAVLRHWAAVAPTAPVADPVHAESAAFCLGFPLHWAGRRAVTLGAMPVPPPTASESTVTSSGSGATEPGAFFVPVWHVKALRSQQHAAGAPPSKHRAGRELSYADAGDGEPPGGQGGHAPACAYDGLGSGVFQDAAVARVLLGYRQLVADSEAAAGPGGAAPLPPLSGASDPDEERERLPYAGRAVQQLLSAAAPSRVREYVRKLRAERALKVYAPQTPPAGATQQQPEPAPADRKSR